MSVFNQTPLPSNPKKKIGAFRSLMSFFFLILGGMIWASGSELSFASHLQPLNGILPESEILRLGLAAGCVVICLVCVAADGSAFENSMDAPVLWSKPDNRSKIEASEDDQ